MKFKCSNGHDRKFYATYTSVAWIIYKDKSGEQVTRQLTDKDGCIMVVHCADCGASQAVEMDSKGAAIEEIADVHR